MFLAGAIARILASPAAPLCHYPKDCGPAGAGAQLIDAAGYASPLAMPDDVAVLPAAEGPDRRPSSR